MLDIVRAILDSAPTWGAGILYIAVIRVLVSFVVFAWLRVPMKEQLERNSRAMERVDALNLGTSDADLATRERISKEEGVSGLWIWAVFGGMLTFGFVMFGLMWAVLADGPDWLAESAGWAGVAAACGEVALAALIAYLRNEGPLDGRIAWPGVVCGLLLLAVPFAIVYALAPGGVVLYAAAVFVLGKTLSPLLWGILDDGKAPIFLGFL